MAGSALEKDEREEVRVGIGVEIDRGESLSAGGAASGASRDAVPGGASQRSQIAIRRPPVGIIRFDVTELTVASQPSLTLCIQVPSSDTDKRKLRQITQ